MIDSNYTLRINRTAKQAFGHDAQFDDANRMDNLVGAVCLVGFGVILGLMLAGWI